MTRLRGVGLVALAVLCAAPARPDMLVDISARSGVDFVHFNGMSGELYFPEMAGSGGALLDYDGDGDLDLYLVQGSLLGAGKTYDDVVLPAPAERPPRDRLLRNDLGGDGVPPAPRFVDVTAAAELAAEGYGIGVAAADYDGDGWPDLYVVNYGANQLWRNQGDGTFRDVTASAGVGDAGWGSGAVFFDHDSDGALDLYVVNYVDFPLARNPACYAADTRRDYCGPQAFVPQADRLYRNRGDGTFEDITRRALLGYAPGPGLGAVSADFNGDRLPDLYVANDLALNQLWLNLGDGTFRDEALLAGVAVNRSGQAEASMGVDAGDFDGDGDEDIFITHLARESNTLYVNDGAALFEDRSVESGLGLPSLPHTGFGTGWVDLDSDGWLDLPVLNGAVRRVEAQLAAGDPHPLAEPNALYRNTGDGRFEDVSARAGEAFHSLAVGRGLAWGDIDQDGDADLLALANGGAARLFANAVGQAAMWLGVRVLTGTGADALGAEVEARVGERSLRRRVRTDGSYASAVDPRVLVGLGGDNLARLTVRWPGGRRRALSPPPGGAYLVVPEPAARPRIEGP